MNRYVLAAALSALTLALTSCGGSTTKTVTKLAPAPSTTSTATPAPPAPATTTTVSTPTAPATTTTVTTSSLPVYFEGVVGPRAIRPSSLQLTGDGTLAVESVQWNSWGGSAATGSGNAEYHGCTPNCAQATPHSALVSIRLSSLRVCSGRRYYSSVTLRMNSGQLLDKQFLQRSWSPC